VFEWVMCSDEAADSHRYMDLLDAAIKAKEAPSFLKYAAWAKKVAAKPRPAEGAAHGSKGKAGKGKRQQQEAEAALMEQIRGRQQRALAVPAGGVLGRLMAEMENSEPSEEDFQKARQRLDQKKAGGKPQKQKVAGAAVGSNGSKRAKK
jgi:DnaJ family protein C protein 9